MATANFYLKDAGAKTETPINLIFRYNGQTLKYSTGERIVPKNWNEDRQRIKKTYTGSPELNYYLDKVEEEIQKIFRLAVSNGVSVTPEYLRQKLNEALNKEPKQNQNFFSLFNLFIEQSGTTKKRNTIKRYRTALNFLKQFSMQKRVSVSFDIFNITFYERFVKFLIEEIGQTNNTVGKYIQTLKTFLNYATENGFNRKLDFKKFKVMREDTEIVYLTEDELNRLAKLELRNNGRLERVRDLFMFGCYTGLRFSDIAELLPENIKGDYIVLQTQKTRSNNNVPISPMARQILKKYDNALPAVISNQKMNLYLKELCALAEINDSVIVIKHRGALRFDSTEPKYKLIGTHTARRTFVTLSLEKGMRAETVMGITGHKTYQVFKKYISITDKVKLNEVNRVWGKQPLMKAV